MRSPSTTSLLLVPRSHDVSADPGDKRFPNRTAPARAPACGAAEIAPIAVSGARATRAEPANCICRVGSDAPAPRRTGRGAECRHRDCPPKDRPQGQCDRRHPPRPGDLRSGGASCVRQCRRCSLAWKRVGASRSESRLLSRRRATPEAGRLPVEVRVKSEVGLIESRTPPSARWLLRGLRDHAGRGGFD